MKEVNVNPLLARAMSLYYDKLQLQEYREANRDKYLFYDYLLSQIVVGALADDFRSGIYQIFYEKGKIVSLLNIKKLTADFGFEETDNTIKGWIIELVSIGALKMEQIHIGDYELPVCVFGTNDEEGEHIFTDDVYLK